MSIHGLARTRPPIHFEFGRLVVPVWCAEMEAHNKLPGDMLDEVFAVKVASDVFFGLGMSLIGGGATFDRRGGCCWLAAWSGG